MVFSKILESFHDKQRRVRGASDKEPFKFPADIKEELDEFKDNIASLNDGWDGDGSKKITKSNYKRLVHFLGKLNLLHDSYGEPLDCPYLSAGKKGEISIHWKDEHHEILLELPFDELLEIPFFGKNNQGTKFKGTVKFEGLEDTVFFLHAMLT